MIKKAKEYLPILLLSLLPTILVWLPFFARLKKFWGIPLPEGGMTTVVSNYDGPLYIAIAKTLYNPELIKQNFSFDLPVEYYAAHFPLYPFLVRLVATITVFPYAMLAVTCFSAFIALSFFYLLAKEYTSKDNALWLTTIFSIFPARWLIIRSVGSPEPLFIATIIASVYFFKKEKYWFAGLFGALAQLTKSPGIPLFLAYLCIIFSSEFKRLANTHLNKWFQKINFSVYPILLIPLSLIAVFALYQQTFNNFFAYFNSGDNIHLFFPPFQIFNYQAPWVNTHWLEEIILFYLICLLGLSQLIKQKDNVLSWFVAIFLSSIFFVSHRDIIRYALPITPFLIIGTRDLLTSKEFKIILCILALPIYLFSLAYISQNTMPISNWSPLL